MSSSSTEPVATPLVSGRPVEKKRDPGPAIKKRGPGRPSKKSLMTPMRYEGIVSAPTDPQDKFELVYNDPIMFKGMFTYFKNIGSKDFHIRCTPEGMTFFTHGSKEKNKVIAELKGENLNRYYCEDTFWVGGRQDKFYQVFSKATKVFSKVTIICKHYDDKIMTVIFKDTELDRECRYNIKLKTLEKDNDLLLSEKKISEDALDRYPINFMLPSKQFKSSITDANSISDTITIEKMGKEALQITTPPDVDIVYKEVYRKDDKIKLRSTVDESSTFRCSFNGGNIKFIATSLVTGDVNIYASEVEDLILSIVIDRLIIYTFVSIDRGDGRHIPASAYDGDKEIS